MNIAFSSDNNYAPYLSISILSILKKNKDIEIHFYILDFGIKENNKKIIEDIIKIYNKKIKFIPISEKDFSNFPITIYYISSATYARLNIAEYIPR